MSVKVHNSLKELSENFRQRSEWGIKRKSTHDIFSLLDIVSFMYQHHIIRKLLSFSTTSSSSFLKLVLVFLDVISSFSSIITALFPSITRVSPSFYVIQIQLIYNRFWAFIQEPSLRIVMCERMKNYDFILSFKLWWWNWNEQKKSALSMLFFVIQLLAASECAKSQKNTQKTPNSTHSIATFTFFVLLCLLDRSI